MIAKITRPLILALVLGVTAIPAALAQDESSKARISLSGTYELQGVIIGDTDVSMDFNATITNTGGTDVNGNIVLRDPDVTARVFIRFGDQSISAGGSVKIESNVSVPRSIYNGWVSGVGPALFFNTENDLGDVQTFRIALSAAKPPKAPGK